MNRNTNFVKISLGVFVALGVAIFPLFALADTGHGKKHKMGGQGSKEHGQSEAAQGQSDTTGMGTMKKVAPRLHVLHLGGEQLMLSQQMTMFSLLVAFGVDAKDNLTRLRKARDSFERVHVGLRVGDEGLGLPRTTRPEILTSLDKLDGLWPQFDAVIQKILKSGKVNPDQVVSLAKLNPQMLTALDEMVDAYEYYAFGGRGFSVLLSTVNVAESQQMRIPKMTTEYLLSVYGHEVAKNKQSLAKTYSEFDRALKGLMDGDAGLRVLPAPTPQIKQGYAEVEQLWNEFQPLMERSAEPGQGDPESVAQMARQVMPLAEKFHEAFHETVALYHHL